jgi:hypothetical protein
MLASRGIPFDVAASLEDHERLSACVVLGELSGQSWDWDTLRWREQ